MRMRIDQPGKHGHLAEIDDAGVAGLTLDQRERPDRLDALSLDQDADIGLDLLRPAIDQPAGFDEHLLWCWCLRGEYGGRGDRQDGDGKRAHEFSKKKRDGRSYSRPATRTTWRLPRRQRFAVGVQEAD